MTVKELIEELQKQDPQTKVYLEQGSGLYRAKALSVKETKLWIENEHGIKKLEKVTLVSYL